MPENVTNRTYSPIEILKRSKIEAREFTYCSVFMEHDHDTESEGIFAGRLKTRHFRFIVLTSSLPVAREAASAIVEHIGAHGWHVEPSAARTARGRSAVSFYPRKYVREARQILDSHPERVFLVDQQTSTSVRT